MNRLKIDYGIDLGTTNSAIFRMDRGESKVIKIEVTDNIMPSCVWFNKKGSIVVGSNAYSSMKSDKRRATKKMEEEVSNAFVDFKRDMGTNKRRYSSNMKRDYSPEELSAEVLKTLKSFVTDATVKSVVITVPAKFTANQVAATKRAAVLAGLEHCEILQEPIAASMAYGMTSGQKNGYWMVFDFGGGTFDAALLKVEEGIMQIFDTEGDNFLGGKDLDEAIVDEIIIPYLKEHYAIDGILANQGKKEILREAMKTYAEDVKNQLSFKLNEDIISNLGDLGEDEEGVEIELDLTVTQEMAFTVMRPLFQKAVDVCKELLKRNNMIGSQLGKLILVGGPTHSPLIRQMLKEQITPNVDTSIDPMTAVACGAALYASTIDSEVEVEAEVGTILLKVGYEATSVEMCEWVSIKLDRKDFKDKLPDKVFVELVRSDTGWASGKVEINEVGNVIEVNLSENKPNSFEIVTYDDEGTRLLCFPNEITIIQGSKVGSAPLPYNIGVEIWNDEMEKAVFTAIPGLEKNKTFPAIGVKNGLKTTKQLRPGMSEDVLRIPVYQADYDAENKPAILFEYIEDITITGEEIESLIPQGSEVDITIRANNVDDMRMEIYFSSVDVTISKELEIKKVQESDGFDDYLQREISKAKVNVRRLSQEGCKLSELEQQLENVQKEFENSSEKKAVLQHLKEVLRKIEDLYAGSEWDRLEKKLRKQFERLEESQQKYGDSQTGNVVIQLQNAIDQVIRDKDVKLGKELLEQIDSLDYKLSMVEYFMAWIYNWHTTFDSKSWKDRGHARQLVNRGMEIINENPTAEKLNPIVGQLVKLLPDVELPEGVGPGLSS